MTPGKPFLVLPAVDDNGNILPVNLQAQEFLAAWNGDHLPCLFECKFCMFKRTAGPVGSLLAGSEYEICDQGQTHVGQKQTSESLSALGMLILMRF
jgi:hypothetical protein